MEKHAFLPKKILNCWYQIYVFIMAIKKYLVKMHVFGLHFYRIFLKIRYEHDVFYLKF